MTQPHTHSHRPAMHARAEALIASFDALTAPQTLTDMLRTARLLMALDRMLTQLWKVPGEKTGGKRTVAAEPQPEETRPEEVPVAETEAAPAPLNRRQRRAQIKVAKGKVSPVVRPATAPLVRYATG